MKTLAKRLCRLEERLACRVALMNGRSALEMLFERIEATAARLRAAGYPVVDSGPVADSLHLYIQQRLRQLIAP